MADPASGLVDPPELGLKLTERAWRFLEREMAAAGKPLPEPVGPVLEFMAAADADPSSLEERLAIVDQAELLFDHLYSHMPFKTRVFGPVHPRDFLRDARTVGLSETETQFHSRMVAAFSIVRDAHTIYGLPSPYRGATAFLPFEMVSIVDSAGERRFIVSRIMKTRQRESGGKGAFGHPHFGPGAEIVSWGGVPTDLHVLRAAGRLPAGNESARFARGCQACTIRPLGLCHFPFDDEMPSVEIQYRVAPMEPELHVIRLAWGVARFPGRSSFPSSSTSINMVDEEFNRSSRSMYRPRGWRPREFTDAEKPFAVSEIPEVFDFQFVGGPRDGRPISLGLLTLPGQPALGYLRIKSFSHPKDVSGGTDLMVNEARRILEILDRVAPDGLIIDIRRNSGGDIRAAERMLQLLTPRRITPENFHFANTGAIRNALRGIGEALNDPTLPDDVRVKVEVAHHELKAWLADGNRTNRALLTSGRPLTSPRDCNDIGQVYQGRIALLVDAFTYSAADIFTAGFDDHDIGFIYGVEQTTGGGGANVWNHEDLLEKLVPKPPVEVARLPRNVSMRLAIRRCSRVGRNRGKPIEDIGVSVHDRYFTNIVNDVLEGFPGMIQEAARILVSQRLLFRVDVPKFTVEGPGVMVDVTSTNVTHLRFLLDGVQTAKSRIQPGETQSFRIPPAAGIIAPSQLRIEGYSTAGRSAGAKPALVAVRNVLLRQSLAAEKPESARDNKAAIRRRR
jgi:hypothetical protein